MDEQNSLKDYFLRSLTPEEYEKVEVPTPEEIRAAFKKMADDFRKVVTAPKPRLKNTGQRYR